VDYAADPDAPYRRPDDLDSPVLPSISDYWPDAPHRMGPEADTFENRVPDNTASCPGRAKPVQGARDTVPIVVKPRDKAYGKMVGRGVFALLAVVLLAAGGVLFQRFNQRATSSSQALPPPTTATSSAAPGPAQPIGNERTAPLGGLEKATFEMVTDTSNLTLRVSDLGDDLYRIATADDAAVKPRVTLNDGRVRLFLDRTGRSGAEEVEVLLSTEIQWHLTLSGGLRQGKIELAGARVDGVDLAGDATRIALTLPRPDGTLAVTMSGGVNTFELNADRGVPVRIRTREGAGQVKVDGRTDNGVARGRQFLDTGWEKSTDRVDLDAVAGVGKINLARSADLAE
jgi:hypothetical protein